MYEVTAPVVVVTGDTPGGSALTYVYRGSVLPETAKSEQVAHLLRRGMIREIETGRTQPASDPSANSPEGDAGSGSGTPQGTPYDDPTRVEARSKLPDDGSAPDGRASKAVLAEWLAGKGYDYDTSIGQDKADLLTLVKQQQSS